MTDLYKQGFIDGLTAYAWWKNGSRYLGTSGRTLKEAISNVEHEWNYNPPPDKVNAALVAALEKLTDQNLTFYRGCVADGQISYADVQQARATLALARGEKVGE